MVPPYRSGVCGAGQSDLFVLLKLLNVFDECALGRRFPKAIAGILADWSVTQVTEYVISTNGDWKTFLPISLRFTAAPTVSSPGSNFLWRFRGREHESASLKLLAE